MTAHLVTSIALRGLTHAIAFDHCRATVGTDGVIAVTEPLPAEAGLSVDVLAGRYERGEIGKLCSGPCRGNVAGSSCCYAACPNAIVESEAA